MISYESALDIVVSHAQRRSTVVVPLTAGRGCVLAEDLVAPFPFPRFDNSAVDGYAVADLDRKDFKVVRTVGAGDPRGCSLGPGECVRIFTGAAVPPGTAAVVMQEDVRRSGDTIELSEPTSVGQHVRRAGEEVLAGNALLRQGQVLSPAGIAIAASAGTTELKVYSKPRIAILTTGSELVPPGVPLEGSQIYESNGVALELAMGDLGIEPAIRETVQDDPDQIVAFVSEALRECDVLIVTGGVSVGDRDIVKDAFAQCGLEQLIWGVAMKPGKPVYFGRKSEDTSCAKFAFGLPGNPLSVLATFEFLVKPFLAASMGHEKPLPRLRRARLEQALAHKPGRREFVPALLAENDRGLCACPFAGQGSHMLGGLARANGWIVVPDESPGLDAGDLVEVKILAESLT